MSESQILKTMVHEVAHSMLHNKEINRDDLIEEPAKDRNTKEVEAESVAYTVCQHFGIDTSDYSFGYIAGWSSGKDMKELKSSLDTIRKTASELITGIEGALRELQLNREMEQEQSKECILLIQNEDLTEFSLVNVRGMDTQELVAALTNMNEDDKLSIQAYLESNAYWYKAPSYCLKSAYLLQRSRPYRPSTHLNTDILQTYPRTSVPQTVQFLPHYAS